MSEEIFELELAGGRSLQRYRAMRPEVEEMPWGTLAPEVASLPPELVADAQRAWTGAAFQEFRTAAACSSTLTALLQARAPVDLIAFASRFPLDEMVHVELCSRVAAELGGAISISYDPEDLVTPLGEGEGPLMRAAHQVVAYFCVGEALSIPLLHGTWKAAKFPLTSAVLERIVRDEADHGQFGWAFLDWATPHLTDSDRAALALTASRAIEGVRRNWAAIRAELDVGARSDDPRHTSDLGWMRSEDYLSLAERSLVRSVLAPLQERGITPPVR